MEKKNIKITCGNCKKEKKDYEACDFCKSFVILNRPNAPQLIVALRQLSKNK